MPPTADWPFLAPHPGTITWRRAGDVRVLIAAGYALLLQVAHPTVGAGVSEHSEFQRDPWGRLLRTLDYACTIVYGGPHAAGEMGQRIRSFHTQIKGTRPDGQRYHALEPSAYAWVHATLAEGILAAHARFGRPLNDEQARQLWSEWRALGRLLGIRDGDLPEGWSGFRDYVSETVDLELQRTAAVEEVWAALARPTAPAEPALWRKLWPLVSPRLGHFLRVSTAGLLEPALRQRLGVGWTRADEFELRVLGSALRAATPLMPPSLRNTGPGYLRWRREATARGDVASAARFDGSRAGCVIGRPPVRHVESMAVDGAGTATHASVDWRAWHSGYERPDSELARRLALVQAQLRAVLDRAAPGPIRAISVCAGQGNDVIGVLCAHPRRHDVSARLVELDPQNVLLAQRAAAAAGLGAVEAIAADASLTDSYTGAVPADLILVCGVFGNISSADIVKTIEQLGRLCAPNATVIWTRHRRPPDLVPLIRETFERCGFGELAFDEAPPFGVGVNRLLAAPQPLQPGAKLFDFIGYEALWPHVEPGERDALGALFRPDCSLVELVEAVRALPRGLPSEPTVESMLLEARGTSAIKHLFLGQVLARRFPETEPALVHRVYRLDRARALELFGPAVAETVPTDGLMDVHRYLAVTLDAHRVSLDATIPGAPWDGRSQLGPVCGPGSDFATGADPDGAMAALVRGHCDAAAREPFLAAVAAANVPDDLGASKRS